MDLVPLAQRGGFQQQSLEALCGMLLGHTWGQQRRPASNEVKTQEGLTSSAQVQCPDTLAWVVREIAVKLAPLWLPV